MDTKAAGESILRDLDYNFAAFTIEAFIHHVEKYKNRDIITIPWDMPPSLFGAWISDGEKPLEYIFYRKDIPPIHQIHTQLHELAHLLLGHPTLQVNRETMQDWISLRGEIPFRELARLRSSDQLDREKEAEVLASLIQEQVIRHALLDRLTQGFSTNEQIAVSLQSLGLVR
ncbi:MAG: hypothetical protein PHQ40_08620 [Anaerolineaceae bacterium]|nr:hypothetical protein [Anaerolineaceae bacterium]